MGNFSTVPYCQIKYIKNVWSLKKVLLYSLLIDGCNSKLKHKNVRCIRISNIIDPKKRVFGLTKQEQSDQG